MRSRARTSERGRTAAASLPAVLLVSAGAGALGLAAALWIALVPVRGARPVRDSVAALTLPPQTAPAALAPTTREPADLRARETTLVAPPAATSTADAEKRADAAIETLRADIDPERFSVRSFERQARVLAGGLRADVGAAGVLALERIAGDGARGERDSIAAAELLRHLRGGGVELPGNALAALRRAWLLREGDATLALAAAGALGLFGDLEDRRAMLDGVSEHRREIDSTLALAGLCAARGDGAVFELAEAVETSLDSRRRDLALCALTQIVAAPDHGLSESGRERCAELLRSELRAAQARGEPPSRIVVALAALEPAEAAQRLLALLADPESSEGTAQGVASRLAAMPCARADLQAVVLDRGLSDARRVLAVEALARTERKVSAQGRALLETVRDREPGTPLGRRAARILARAETGMVSAIGEEPDG